MSALEPVVSPEAAGFDAARLERIRHHFDGYVADARLAGWLVTIAREGRLVWTAKGGDRDRERGLAMSDDTLFRIFSMTKPIVSVLAMMLYEEGVFDLNDEVARWLPSLASPRVWVGGTAERPQTRPAEEPVRVRHLLSHQSGLTYGFQRRHPVDAIYRSRGYDLYFPSDRTLAEAVDDWCSAPLLFDPGSAWNYSVATDVVGRLIECWTGSSLDAVLQERLLAPLQMTDTGWSVPEEQLYRLAQLYVPSSTGCRVAPPGPQPPTQHPAILSGGGGLVSSARDYERFMAMLVHGGSLDGRRYLSRRTLALMTANHLPGGVDLAHAARDSFSESPYAGIGFGLGFSVVLDAVRHQALTTPGTFAWGGAASTAFWVDPATSLSVGFYTQMLPSSTYPLRRELQQLVYAALLD